LGHLTTPAPPLQDDGELVYYPNAKIRSQNVANMTRSDGKFELLKFLVDLDTPGEVRLVGGA